MNLHETLIICKDVLRNEFKNSRVLITIILFLIISLLSIYSASIIQMLLPNSVISGSIIYITTFLVLLLLGPIFVIALSHNSISSEIESGTIRFIIPKMNRSSFILGKFMGLIIVFSLIIGIVYVILFIYSALYMQTNTPLYPLLSWFLLSLYFACFVGICLNISLLANNSSTALVLSITSLIILLAFSTGFKYEFLKYLSPTWYSFIGFDATFNPKAAPLQIFKSIGGMLFLITVSLVTLLYSAKRRDF
jgi:ABC-2 type transport system permease protein